jgi:hypothetical protein
LPDDDNSFFVFAMSVLQVNEEIITADGYKILTFPIKDMVSQLYLKEQKTLVKLSLYFTLVYNVLVLFAGMIQNEIEHPFEGSDGTSGVNVFLSLENQKRAMFFAGNCKMIIDCCQRWFNEDSALKFGELRHIIFIKKVFASSTYKLPDLDPSCPDDEDYEVIQHAMATGREIK